MSNNIDYKKKSLKYKTKYLKLKAKLSKMQLITQSGGKGSITKINDRLYRGDDVGIYYVMERIDGDEKRITFWKQYITNEDANHSEYRLKFLNNSIPAE